MAFSFPQVQNNILVPGVYPEVTLTTSGLTPVSDKVLLVAQMSPSGSAIDGQVVSIFDEADAILYFGKGSPAHLASVAALTANPSVDLAVLATTDSSGVDATALITVAGIPDGPANYTFYIDDVQISYDYDGNAQGTVDITKAIANLISAQEVPCTTQFSESTVLLTATAPGTWGNTINFSLSADTTDVSVGNTFVGGLGTVNLGNYQTAGTYAATIANGKWSVIANCLDNTSTISVIDTILDFRASATVQTPAVQIVAYNNNILSTVDDAISFANTIDYPRTAMAYLNYTRQPVLTSPGYKLSASFGSMIPISSGVTVNVPYDGLVLDGISSPAVNDQFNGLAQQAMLEAGLTPLIVVPGEQVAICRAVSTDIDVSQLKDINTIRQIDYVSAQFVTNLKVNFQRVQLSGRTLKSIVSNVANTSYQLESAGILQNTATLSGSITALPNSSTVGRVDVTVPVELVVGLHVIAVDINVQI
jgi:phage tail sheath gpL-like